MPEFLLVFIVFLFVAFFPYKRGDLVTAAGFSFWYFVRLLFYLRGMASTVFYTVIVSLASIAPRVGSRMAFSEVRLRAWVKNRLGEEFQASRDRTIQQLIRHSGTIQFKRKKSKIREEIHETHTETERRHRVGELVITVVGGTLSVFLAALGYLELVALAVSFLVAIFPLASMLRIAIVDILLFNDYDAAETNTRRKLVFMEAWNRAILNKNKMITYLILGALVKGGDEAAEELSEEMMDYVLSGKGDLVDAIEVMTSKQLDEDVSFPGRFKRLFRRFL